MTKKLVGIVPLFDVVESYLQKEDVSNLPKEWQKFNASAQECMAILKEILGLTQALPAKGIKTGMPKMMSRPSSPPECTDIPKWSAEVNEFLTNSIPVDKLTKK